MSDKPQFVKKEHLINKLRELGFTFSRHGDRTEIWKKKGDTLRVNVPRRKNSVDAKRAGLVLKSAGCQREDILAFLADRENWTDS